MIRKIIHIDEEKCILRVTYSTKASLYPSYLSFVISCLSTLSIMG